MRTKFSVTLTLFLTLLVQIGLAQEKLISGTVTDMSGIPLPGANVLIKGTSSGTQTDFDGNYTIDAEEGQILVISYIGMKTAEVAVGTSSSVNIQLREDAQALEEVVVTALGIEREKKSLGYATQEVTGDEVSTVPNVNFANSLSGKVSGVRINPSGTMGGSTNVIIRGNTSLTGNNQALFVIDGTPIGNNTDNTSDQTRGRGGYDYGNAASDINPDDIASINVLKGAAATALYGARAANGAIIIETKKGKKQKGIGVSVSSTLMASKADKETLPKYQNRYGAGYSPGYDTGDGFWLFDINGNGNHEETTPFTADASYGAAFDPNRMIYQWNSIYPQLADTYMQPTPWVAARHTPNDIWETGVTSINSVALDGGSETSTFRLSATNFMQDGNLPNSNIKRNTIKFSGSHDFSEKFSALANITYTKTDGRGRYGTGYDSENIMQQFRQWWQTNVDIREQRDAYLQTRENITWNPNSPANLSPIYSDNPYWTRYENYQTDTRNRYFGNMNLNYKISDVFSLMGRFSFDTYDELREERRNVGSSGVSGYRRFNNRVSEYNYDIILNFNKNLSEDLNLDGNIGWNLRRNDVSNIDASTNGGLTIPGLYSLQNSANPMEAPIEYEATSMLDGIYGRVSLGYKGTYYIEGTLRRDRSSTLPTDNNTFYYPSISGSLLLSNLINAEWLNFTKIRANYAEVGNDTDPYRLLNTYTVSLPFGGAPVANNIADIYNANLKPERSKSYEFGVESSFFDNRIGFNVTYYRTKTEDLITQVPISSSTGFNNKWQNAGIMENKGWEVMLNLNPVRTQDFNWDMVINWSRNRSKILSLADGITNLQIASLQGGVSINATPGQPYGAIRGSDYIYDDSGNKVVGEDGYYLVTDTNNEIIGNIQPDWIGGVRNTLKYKNVSLSFLIDVQHGGDIFSLDTWYGFATGLYDRTAANNDLGNPMRNPLNQGGGIILPGVTENGDPNTTRIPVTTSSQSPYGYTNDANAGHVYDASFVKLREVSLAYSFPDKILDVTPFTSASISLIGRNLWIIHKNLPYSDPEAGLSAGNIQGYQSGAYPAFREVGASLKFNF